MNLYRHYFDQGGKIKKKEKINNITHFNKLNKLLINFNGKL